MKVYFLIYDIDNGRLVNIHTLTYKGKKSDVRRIICSEYWLTNVEVEVRLYDCASVVYRNNRRNYNEIYDFVDYCFDKYGYKEFYKGEKR